ncbi:MAG: hypothetical protein Q9195_008024 [Heterodermia aff. obscurata]
MAEPSHPEARKIIEGIMRRRGVITPAERADTPPEVLETLDNLREDVARNANIFANQLYHKETKFIYELIQNAEDNTYNICEAEKTLPALKFTVSPDCIIIDSNEDGFSEDNVQAICGTGESSKKFSRGSIGEKGIGFKSVFKIASRVRVQSGPFCFAFKHGDDDNGLGMITPINEEHEQLPTRVRTRFTLTLKGYAGFEETAQELSDLPYTLLLFLKKLKRIIIWIQHDASLSKTVYECIYDEGLRLGTMSKREESNDKNLTNASSRYYIERSVVQDLPADDARPHTSEAEVVLAFPIDEEGEPVIEEQHVFAYLPMRKVGFKAVSRFCENHPLEFTWMRYLPNRSIADPFWSKLQKKIYDRLRERATMQTWGFSALRRAQDVRYVPTDCLDANGEPLFANSEIDTGYNFLSPKYSTEDIELLRDLGVETLSDDEFCQLVKLDLQASKSTSIFSWPGLNYRLKSEYTSGDWHTRVADKLSAIAKTDLARVRDLECIPLENGSWVSSQCKTFFPEYHNVPVPTDLTYNLVHKEALKNPARKKLFYSLGSRSCEPQSVISLIIKKYEAGRTVEPQNSVSHLRWMYQFLPVNERQLNRCIPLFASDDVPTFRFFPTLAKEVRKNDLYFETKDEFGVKELCRKPSTMVPTSKEIWHDVYLLNKLYLDAVEPTVLVQGESWIQWLENGAGVRRIPRLVKSNDSKKLSDLFSWLVLNRPDKVPATLHTYWSSYKHEMKPEIINVLRDTKVLSNDSKLYRLKNTWLPTSELLEICKNLDIVKKMPFLKISEELDSEKTESWKFLGRFGVDFNADTTFYLKTLRVFKACHDISVDAFPRDLVGVYEAIEKNSSSAQYDKISDCFEKGSYILGPIIHEGTWKWELPEDCLWEAPAFIEYRTILGSSDIYKNNRSIKHLFHEILRIPDLEIEHCIEQLIHWQKDERVGDIEGLYQHLLQSMRSSDSKDHRRLRCAVHYQNSSAIRHQESLYQRLRRARVYTSDNISSTVKLVLNSTTIATKTTHGSLHLEDNAEQIKLFVPRNTKEIELCYLTKVPERLVTYFGIEDAGAAKAFGDILRCSPQVLNDVLETHGIVRVPGVVEQSTAGTESPALSVSSERGSPMPHTESYAVSPSSFSDEETLTSEMDRTGSAPLAYVSTSSTESVSQKGVDHTNKNYRALLDHIIKSAQSESAQLELVDDRFIPDNVFGVRSTNQVLHDRKIGAAGELYAFEYLSSFLPNFSRSNWRSKIRKYVCVHEKYGDMSSFDGTETADLVYEDKDGMLTAMLIDEKHLDEEIWLHKRPKYFLEVKATTQECKTRFFMSKEQVRRMERMVLPSGKAAAEVYVIVRVWNIGQNDIGLDFIVDPETQRRSGELHVEADSYTIHRI